VLADEEKVLELRPQSLASDVDGFSKSSGQGWPVNALGSKLRRLSDRSEFRSLAATGIRSRRLFAMKNVAVLGIRAQHIKAAALSRNLCNGLQHRMSALFFDWLEIAPANVNHGRPVTVGRASLYANCLVSMRISD
jgi:hypothetical protein